MGDFVHLHVHTEYSLLDGVAKIKKLVAKAKSLGMSALAITDHGNMYGVIKFRKECIAAGIKPIIGSEFYFVEDMRDRTESSRKKHHLILLAKNYEGYKNLMKLSSLSFLEGFYYKPSIDMNLLKKYSKGLICLTACIQGAVPNYLITGQKERAYEHAKILKDIFKDDLYIELQDHGLEDEKKALPLLAKLAVELGIKTVATNDVHYVEKTDKEMQDVMICVQTKSTFKDDNRMIFDADNLYLKSYDEMLSLFSWNSEAVENTLEIADKCNVVFPEKQKLLPFFVAPDNMTPAEYLRKLTYEGLEKRYKTVTEEIRKRADYELDIIISLGFAEYFLIVWDFIDFAHKHDVPVGPGRGSGVGSIVAYAIKITSVDPLKFDLLFERFLNPARVSNPDFDIDFCFEGREKVIDYVFEKYGRDKVSQIITFGTMACKAAIKDVARVYGDIPYEDINKLNKLIPGGKLSIEGILGVPKDFPPDKKDKQEEYEKMRNQEVIDLYNSNADVKKVLDMASKVEGLPRNTSMHAAGVVICRDPISEHSPLQTNGGIVTTQYDKDEVEGLGLLKMDFLGLRTLTDIALAKKYVKQIHGVDIDFEKLGYEDKKVYDFISKGDTVAVFQLESEGITKFMTELKPVCMEEILAGISLYRPGPMASIGKYIYNKNHPDKIEYDHPWLEDILKVTYGCIVYQEQVMQIVQKLGGFSLGRADEMRRAMSKKKKDKMEQEEKVFIYGCDAVPEVRNQNGELVTVAQAAVDGAIKRGVPLEVAKKVYKEMKDFASYAFNKSHAAAYAVITYETAYIKNYYPVEYIVAVINNRITKVEEVSHYVNHLRSKKIKILPPDINKSEGAFTIENNSARFGLMAIKNVGEKFIENIVEERIKNGNYTGFQNFMSRIDTSCANSRMIQSLIFAGAFDTFGKSRASLICAVDSQLKIASENRKSRLSGQMSLFDMMPDIDKGREELPDVKEYETLEKLHYEKDVLGIYLSGHPLDAYFGRENELNFTTDKINKNLLIELGASFDDEEGDGEDTENNVSEDFDTYPKNKNKFVTAGGIISNIRKMSTKKNQPFVAGELEDYNGTLNFICFPANYEKYKSLLVQDNIVKMSGFLTLDSRGDEDYKVQLQVNKIELWEESKNKPSTAKTVKEKIYINFNGDDILFSKIMKLLNEFKGDTPVLIQNNKKLLDSGVKADNCWSLLNALEELVGKNNLIVR